MRREENHLDVTECFIALTMCSTCFGHWYAHHQELKTICVLLPPMVWSAWLLVVRGQVQGSRLWVQEEGCYIPLPGLSPCCHIEVYLLVSIKNTVFCAVILVMEETGLHVVVTALYNIPEDGPSPAHPCLIWCIKYVVLMSVTVQVVGVSCGLFSYKLLVLCL